MLSPTFLKAEDSLSLKKLGAILFGFKKTNEFVEDIEITGLKKQTEKTRQKRLRNEERKMQCAAIGVD